jgi:hypothetical protein
LNRSPANTKDLKHVSETRLDAVSEFGGAASLLRASPGVMAVFFANGPEIQAPTVIGLQIARAIP